VIDRILDLYNSHHDPTGLSVNNIPIISFNLYRAGLRFFGKWSNAVKASGLNYEEIELMASSDNLESKYLDEDVIVDRIIKLYKAGEDLSSKHVAEVYPDLWHSASSRRNFGNWGRALVSAGLEYGDIIDRSRKTWNYETVVESIYEIHESVGDLNHEYIMQEYPMLLKAAKKYFDTWNQAIIQTGFNPDRVKYDAAMEPFRIFLLKNYAVEIFNVIEKSFKPYKKLHPEIAQDPTDESNPVPSFIDTSNGFWIEIQLRSWKRGLEDELNLYFTQTDQVIIYYLLGEPRNWYKDKVIFNCFKDMFPKLVDAGREDLIRDLNLIERGRVPDRFSEQYNEYVAKSKEH
jgi:hypothetical protein